MKNLHLDNYENKVKVANRPEYDKYIMTMYEPNLNKVFASIIFTINFEGEDKALNAIKDGLETHYKLIFKDFGKLGSVEHSASTLLNVLETDVSDVYYKNKTLDLTSFRGRSAERSNKLFFEMPKFVKINFQLIDGEEDYLSDVEKHENEQKRLFELFDTDAKKYYKMSDKLYQFLVKDISKDDMFKYIDQVINTIDEYQAVIA